MDTAKARSGPRPFSFDLRQWQPELRGSSLALQRLRQPTVVRRPVENSIPGALGNAHVETALDLQDVASGERDGDVGGKVQEERPLLIDEPHEELFEPRVDLIRPKAIS